MTLHEETRNAQGVSSKRRPTLCGAFCALALLVAAPASVMGHGSSDAGAKRPQFDQSALRLVGKGGFGTARRHRAIRVTVCLDKRYGKRFYAVRCKTVHDDDRRVRAQVRVPGCVDGVWRTTASGEALGRGGEWKHAASDRSATFRC